MKDLFLLFVRINIEASILIGIILILRAIFRKVPRAYIYGLWLVALLRLLCPVHIEADSPVVPGFTNAVTQAIVNDDWQTGDGAVGKVITDDGGQVLGPSGMTDIPLSNMTGRSSMDILSLLWLTGAGVCAIMYTGRYIRMRKRLKTAIRVADGIWESDMVQSPFVMGLIRPRIYLPVGLEGAEKEHILAHERMHIRHFDTSVRVLGLVALCLHWWNPLIWLSIRLMNQDMEMVCDESVLKAADIPARKAYMHTLLTYSMRQSGLSITPYFGETNTEKRIRHIMLYKKPTLIIGGILLFAIIACVIIFFVVPDTGDRPDSPAMADVEIPTPEPVQATDAPDEQPEMTYSEYLTGYSGYLDELNMFEGAYDGLDYDGDGRNDRVYRRILDTDENGGAIRIGYRVDFGNGDTLEIGGFDDVFTGIDLIGYDLTGNGVNEIIYRGLHGGSTFPPMGSEIAVFAKTDAGYEMLFLPRFDDWEIDASPYATGFSIYCKDVTETSATLYSPQFGYEERIDIDQNAYEYCFKDAGSEPVGSQAWRVAVDTVEGVPVLVLYVNIGFKYYERDLAISLTWQDGECNPVDMALEPIG